MQTTLTIDDDVLAAAENLAAQSHQTVGEVISSLSRQSLPEIPDRNGKTLGTHGGLPLLPRTANPKTVTLEMVEQLKDELGY